MANEDNDDLLNIIKTFGTKHGSLKDLLRKPLYDFKPPTDDPTIKTYIQEAPPQDNIFLSELSIAAVTAFVHKVSTYQQRCKISISVGLNISSSIVHLLANLNECQWVLSNPKIELILKKSVQPKSAKEFIEAIQLLVKFRLTKESFEIIYRKFLIYSSKFRRLVDFMTGVQDSKELPPLEKKNKALIYHYLEGLPETFAKTNYDILLSSKI